MTELLAALDEAIRETGVERYEFLCLEHSDPAVRAEWSRWIVARGWRVKTPPPESAAPVEYTHTPGPCGGCP